MTAELAPPGQRRRPHWTETHWRARGWPSITLRFDRVDPEVLALILVGPSGPFITTERFAQAARAP